MLQSLLGGDAVLGIVDEDALQEVEEESVELVIGGDEFLTRR